jgi:CheY-like chemotaxis protein
LILVVEDEPAVRRLIVETLQRDGYVVRAVGDPRAAIELGRFDRFDLLLTDVVMPGMSGPELAIELRELGGAARTLFVSGYLDRAGASELSGGPLLSKPFTTSELSAAVRAALDGPKAE